MYLGHENDYYNMMSRVLGTLTPTKLNARMRFMECKSVIAPILTYAANSVNTS